MFWLYYFFFPSSSALPTKCSLWWTQYFILLLKWQYFAAKNLVRGLIVDLSSFLTPRLFKNAVGNQFHSSLKCQLPSLRQKSYRMDGLFSQCLYKFMTQPFLIKQKCYVSHIGNLKFSNCHIKQSKNIGDINFNNFFNSIYAKYYHFHM